MYIVQGIIKYYYTQVGIGTMLHLECDSCLDIEMNAFILNHKFIIEYRIDTPNVRFSEENK